MTDNDFVGYCPDYCNCPICQNARETVRTIPNYRREEDRERETQD